MKVFMKYNVENDFMDNRVKLTIKPFPAQEISQKNNLQTLDS